MTAQFDALTQLFQQIMERLIRIETKLDTKADLSSLASIEGRVRSLELTESAQEQIRSDFIPRFIAVERTVNEINARAGLAPVTPFNLGTWKKRLAAAGVAAVFVANVVVALVRALGARV